MKKMCDYMSYWLFKSEPSDYSFEDLINDKETEWEGIRNYQARNFIRDKIKIGDEILFYHSMISTPHVVGIAKVTSKAYPDFFALDKAHKYYDPKSSEENPRWFMVDIKAVRKLDNIVTLKSIKNNKLLNDMVLVNNSRLSIQPVTDKEWDLIINMSSSG